jgi:hypothetical protein
MDADALKAWIRDHHVCWELSPHVEQREHERVVVGYELTLLARYPETFKEGPGSTTREQIYEGLREVVAATLPEGESGSRFDFEPFDASVHLRPETQFAPEVELKVDILHAEGTFAPADAGEQRLAARIQDGLKRLGVRSKT